MTVIELAMFTLWVGFGIRAGWMACDALIEAIPALIEHLERRRYRRELAHPSTVTIVSSEIRPDRTARTVEYPASGGVIRQPVGGMLVGEHTERTVKVIEDMVRQAVGDSRT